MRRIQGIAAAICAATAFAIAAPADAAPGWRVVPTPAPGGVAANDERSTSILAMTVVGNTPYLGWTDIQTEGQPGDETGAITIWRLDASGTGWEQVGGPQNHDPGTLAWIPPHGMASVGGALWFTWGEYGGENYRLQVRVSRLADGSFQEVAGGQPVNDPAMHANAGQLATLDGRVYVLYEEAPLVGGHHPPRVARVAADGGSFEDVSTGLPDTDSSSPSRFVAAGGRLHYLHQHAFDRWTLFAMDDDAGAWSGQRPEFGRVADAGPHDGALHVAFSVRDVDRDGVWRLAQQGGLQQVGNTPFEDAHIETIASAGGTLYAAGWTEPQAPPYTGELRFAAYRDGAWQQLPVPTAPGERVGRGAKLAAAADGAVWLRYTTVAPDGATTERVARFGEPPAPPSDGAPTDPVTPGAPAGPPAPGGGGFTDPQGNPAPDQTPAVPRRGACANRRVGSTRADRLVGGSLGERISGLAGDDELFGGRGADCVSGDSGFDVVSGGPGRDLLSGGSGSDRLVPGPGRDGVAAGRGPDTIVAVGGGVDRVNCGPGYDRVRLSRNDLIKGCEHVVVVRR